MKKFNALLSIVFMVMLSLPAVGQVINQAPVNGARLVQSNIKHSADRLRINDHKRVVKDVATRANTSFLMDYDSLNNNDAAFFWTMNKNFIGGGDLNYAIVTFDSLADLAGTGYNYDQHTVTVDTIEIFLSHVNASGQEDTIIVSIVELDPVTNYWTNNVLWSDSAFSATSLTSAVNSFGILPFYPNFAMCQGRFGVRVDFYGPATDTMAVIAGFKRGACATQGCTSGNPGAEDISNFYPNSYYGYQNGPNSPVDLPTAMGGDLYRDCSGDMMFTPANCEFWYIQDFWIWPSVTIQDTPPAALTATTTQTLDDGTGNGTATVTATGGVGELTYIWNTTPPQTGATATGLAAGTYSVVISYGSNCDAIQESVEIILDNVSIDDLDAGISSLMAFPNPNNGQFNLTFEMDNADNVLVSVYDLTGKLIHSESAANVRDFNGQINLNDAANGIYLLRVETSLGATTRRIVKQ